MGKNKKTAKEPKQIHENRGKSEKNVDPEYAVGYKNPPRYSQFKPGQSGNAKGRPKKSITFAEVIAKQVRKSITVSVGGKSERTTRIEAIGIKQISKALSGDNKSAALIIEALKLRESDNGNPLRELLHQFRLQDATNESGEPTSLPLGDAKQTVARMENNNTDNDDQGERP